MPPDDAMAGQPDRVVDLATARASRSGYAKDWTPLMALKAVVREIEDGTMAPDMVFVAMRQTHGEETASYDFACAGGDDVHLVGLLTMHVHQLLNET